MRSFYTRLCARSSCAKLCECLTAAAVNLRRRQEQPLAILNAISRGLAAVLTLLKVGQFSLHDGDCVRLLTTAGTWALRPADRLPRAG
jgi:hypothetical protein